MGWEYVFHYFYFYSYFYCYYYYYCCIFICDFIAKVAIVNGRMCSADTEHLHPSKVTVQLGEWLQEKWFFCPISLIFCTSSKLTAHECLISSCYFERMEMNLSISFLALMICQKSFALFFLLTLARIHSSSNAGGFANTFNHAPCLIYVDIYAFSNDTICMQLV